MLLAMAVAAAANPAVAVWTETFSGAPIDLADRPLAFSEEFDGDVSLTGPKLFAPVHAPYGAGKFDPPTGPAYKISDGVLSLRAYKTPEGTWRSGTVQTVDKAGQGFTCADCYFEARIKLPSVKTSAFWGGLWLLSNDDPVTGHAEIDVLEWYGGDPKGHHQALHLWQKAPLGHSGSSNYTGMGTRLLDGAWHTYGVQKRGDTVTFYMDRQEVSRAVVGPGFNVSYYPLVSLTINPGEIADAVDGMTLQVDYIRAYAAQ